ncbi:MAG: DUF4159 domain-containing protein [Candidatus Kapaibacterium sp.]
MKYLYIIMLAIMISGAAIAQNADSGFRIGRVQYSGGGDWYNDPSAEINLLKFVRDNTNIDIKTVYEYVDLASDNLFIYPMIFITGHGNLKFSKAEVERLRAYLENGGFLYIDDDYGLDEYIRKEMKRVFPEKEFTELPFSHGIYSCHFEFPQGPPKTHEHDEKVPQAFGIFHEGRLCVYYTFESNPSDGWADPDVHRDPEAKRIESLKFGTNIIVWALTH